jgi:hypothetical protein
MRLCYYHYCQNLLRKKRSLGLECFIKENSDKDELFYVEISLFHARYKEFLSLGK